MSLKQQVLNNNDFRMSILALSRLTALLSGKSYFETGDVTYFISWVVFGILSFLCILLQVFYKNTTLIYERFSLKDSIDRMGFKMVFLALLLAIIIVIVIFSGLYFIYSFFGLLPFFG